jgi:hypothetical protein
MGKWSIMIGKCGNLGPISIIKVEFGLFWQKIIYLNIYKHKNPISRPIPVRFRPFFHHSHHKTPHFHLKTPQKSPNSAYFDPIPNKNHFFALINKKKKKKKNTRKKIFQKTHFSANSRPFSLIFRAFIPQTPLFLPKNPQKIPISGYFDPSQALSKGDDDEEFFEDEDELYFQRQVAHAGGNIAFARLYEGANVLG